VAEHDYKHVLDQIDLAEEEEREASFGSGALNFGSTRGSGSVSGHVNRMVSAGEMLAGELHEGADVDENLVNIYSAMMRQKQVCMHVLLPFCWLVFILLLLACLFAFCLIFVLFTFFRSYLQDNWRLQIGLSLYAEPFHTLLWERFMDDEAHATATANKQEKAVYDTELLRFVTEVGL
jgi:hypothetical protein